MKSLRSTGNGSTFKPVQMVTSSGQLPSSAQHPPPHGDEPASCSPSACAQAHAVPPSPLVHLLHWRYHRCLLYSKPSQLQSPPLQACGLCLLGPSPQALPTHSRQATLVRWPFFEGLRQCPVSGSSPILPPWETPLPPLPARISPSFPPGSALMSLIGAMPLQTAVIKMAVCPTPSKALSGPSLGFIFLHSILPPEILYPYLFNMFSLLKIRGFALLSAVFPVPENTA